jgi:hypothetical protein
MNDSRHSIAVGEKPGNGSESGGRHFPTRFFAPSGSLNHRVNACNTYREEGKVEVSWLPSK